MTIKKFSIGLVSLVLASCSNNTSLPTSTRSPTITPIVINTSATTLAKTITPATRPKSSNTPAPKASTTGWQTYKDPYTNFSIQYPANGKVINRSTNPDDIMVGLTNIPQSATPPTSMTEYLNSLPADAYLVEIGFNKHTVQDEEAIQKLNMPKSSTTPTGQKGLGANLLPVPMKVEEPEGTCNGSIYPETAITIDNIPGFFGSVPLVEEGFVSKGYCFKMEGKDPQTKHVDILVRVSAKEAYKSLVDEISETIHFN